MEELMGKINKAIEVFNLSVASVRPVTESYSSTVRILELINGEKVVLKIPFNREKIEREVRVLELLSNNPLVPDLLNVWYGDESNIGAILMSYIEGEPMKLPVDDKIVYDMGKALATLHNVKLEKFELNEAENDWWESIRNRFKLWMEEIDGYIPLLLQKKIESYYDTHILGNYMVDGPCLVHFDYRPGNLLVKDGKLVGVIDFETSRGGSAEIDFTKMAEYLWKDYPDTKSVFLSGYKSLRNIPDIEETLPIYTIHNAVGGIVWCVRRDKLDDEFYYENLNLLETCLIGETLSR